MPTLNWLTREQDLKSAAETPYRLLVEDETVLTKELFGK